MEKTASYVYAERGELSRSRLRLSADEAREKRSSISPPQTEWLAAVGSGEKFGFIL